MKNQAKRLFRAGVHAVILGALGCTVGPNYERPAVEAPTQYRGAASAAPPLLEVRGLRVEFPTRRGTLTALDGVSFAIAAGEVLGVVGESGAGKSMTGAAIIGLIEPPGRIAGGQILLDGRRIDHLGPEQMRRVRGREIGAIISAEIGGANSVVPLAVGRELGLPVIDADGMGRAYPEIQLCTFTLYGHSASPLAVADEHGNVAVLDTIADQHLLDQVKRVGEYLAHGLDALTGPLVTGHRGSGLWRAITLAGPHAAAIEAAARNRGLLVNAVKPDAVRLAPPLVLTESDVDEALPKLTAALDEVNA